MTRHQIVRHRHELRRRTLTVSAIENVTPNMLRVHFTSDELGDFVSASFDDHVKVFIGAVPEAMGGPGGPGGERPPMRDFTPRKFDTAAGTLAIDFALHEAGPAADWAKSAQVGGTLTIGGPRGSAVIPDDFEWYLLIGDETALPAIGRRVEELRADVPVITLGVVADADEAQQWQAKAQLTPHWLLRSGGEDDVALIVDALAGITLPPGDGFIWIAAEASVARAVRRYVVEDMNHPKEWLKAAGYWQRGTVDSHVRIED